EPAAPSAQSLHRANADTKRPRGALPEQAKSDCARPRPAQACRKEFANRTPKKDAARDARSLRRAAPSQDGFDDPCRTSPAETPNSRDLAYPAGIPSKAEAADTECAAHRR